METLKQQYSDYSEEVVLNEVDQAIEKENRDKTRGAKKAPRTENEKVSGLPQLMRWLGGIVLIAAAATCLLQRPELLEHTARYYSFLGFTVGLTIAGFFCGLQVKDDKGARTFLALSAAVMPVNFCQLGALIYSLYHPNLDIDKSFLLVASSTGSVVVAAIIGAILVAPAVFIAFSSLIRHEATAATVAYLGINSLILLPSRDPGFIAVASLTSFIFAVAFNRQYLRGSTTTRTKEATFVRVMMIVPAVLMVVRNLHLYSLSAVLVSTILAAVALFFMFFLPDYLDDRESKINVQGISVLPAMLSWNILAEQLVKDFAMPVEYAISFYALPMAVILIVMSKFSFGGGRNYRNLASFVAVGGVILQLLSYPGSLSSVLCITVSIFSILYGYMVEQRFSFANGVVGFILGIGYHLHHAIRLFEYSPWVSLAVIGMVTIVLSSYIERNSQHVIQRLRVFGKQFRTWE